MRFSLPFLSALLFWASFPPVDCGFLGWVALVPLIVFAAGEEKGWRAFLIGWAAGACFFTASLWWLRYTTGTWGPTALSLYLGLYWGVFCSLVRGAGRGECARMPVAVAAPVAWIALELVRSILFTGMPLFLAGYTQHGFPALIQIADLGGVWLVSLIVVLVNSAIARAFLMKERDREYRVGAAVSAAAVALMGVYGGIRLATLELEDGMKVGIVQANIAQDVKELAKVKSPEERRRLWEIHMEATLEVAKEKPDLIVWPEVATLEELVWMEGKGWDTEDPHLLRTRMVAEKTGVRALVGAMVIEPPAGEFLTMDNYENSTFTNSAIYFDEKGEIVGRFDKIKLVPFAERMLFGDVLPVSKWVAGILKLSRVFEFRPGRAMPVFDHPKGRFAALICSENSYPEISREFAGKGARVLVNISNDGWFGDSAELDQMLAMAKFRAVENRVHYVRATNTGISAMIEPTGRIAAVIEDARGRRKGVGGTMARVARVTRAAPPYRVLGDWAAWLCAGLCAGGWPVLKLRRRRKSVDTPKVGA